MLWQEDIWRNNLPHLNFIEDDHDYFVFEEKNNVSMDGDSGQEGDEEIFSYENFDHEKPLCKT